jgi:hypothetical protein
MTEKTQAEILAIIERYDTELLNEKHSLEELLSDKCQIYDNLRNKIISILDKRIAIIEIKQRILDKSSVIEKPLNTWTTV